MSATPQLPPLAKIEQKTVVDLLAKGKRIAERGPNDYREMTLEVGLIEKANGSAQIHLGKTKILVGVKVETGTPFPDTPDQGVLTVNAELVPMASPLFEPGPPNEDSIELARVVDRGIRESKTIDLKKLCILPGKKAFVVFVDVYVLDHDGNLIDAASIASLAALLNAKMREFKLVGEEIHYADKWTPLPLLNRPVATTFAKIDNTMVVDPSIEEEQVMTARLTVTVEKDNNVCAMQKGGLGTITVDEAKRAVRIAIEKSGENRARIMQAVGAGRN